MIRLRSIASYALNSSSLERLLQRDLAFGCDCGKQLNAEELV